MMRLLETELGYYDVDNVPDALLTYKRMVNQLELMKAVDPYFVKYIVFSKKIENQKIPDGYHFLGYDEQEDSFAITQIAYWAKNNHYRYVRKK